MPFKEEVQYFRKQIIPSHKWSELIRGIGLFVSILSYNNTLLSSPPSIVSPGRGGGELPRRGDCAVSTENHSHPWRLGVPGLHHSVWRHRHPGPIHLTRGILFTAIQSLSHSCFDFPVLIMLCFCQGPRLLPALRDAHAL